MGHCITRSLCYSLDAVGTSVFRSSTWTRCAGLDLHPNSWWENPQEGYKCKLLGVSRIISRNSISGWFFRFAVRCQSQSILKSHLELWAGWRVEFPTRPIPQWLWFLHVFTKWVTKSTIFPRSKHTVISPMVIFPPYPHFSPFTSSFLTNRPGPNRPPR